MQMGMSKKTVMIISIAATIALIAVGGILLYNKYHRKSVGRSNPLQHIAADGIDISHHNTVANWDSLKVQFIYAKATEGKSHQDTKFENYRKNALEHGIPFGAYHFLSVDVSAKEQIENFKRMVPKDSTTLIPVLDVEQYTDRQKLKTLVAEWINECYNYYGVYPMIYGSPAFLYDILKGTPQIEKCPFWVSVIGTRNPSLKRGKMVQFKIDKVEGMEGEVDCNYLNGSLDELRIKEETSTISE